MADAKTLADSIGIYLTGADYGGGAQNDPDACLGGFRSNVEVRPLFGVVSDGIGPISIDHVAGIGADSVFKDGVGTGTITGVTVTSAKEIEDALDMTDADKQHMFHADTVSWIAANGAAGATAVLDVDTTVTIGGTGTGTDIGSFARVSRDSAAPIEGDMLIDLVKDYNNVIGMDNITSTERVAGNNTYRAIFFRAHGSNQITNLQVWIGILSSNRTGGVPNSDAGQLGASGAGTIVTTGSFGDPSEPEDIDFQESGMCYIIQSDLSTIREIVYYTNRTPTALTVPAGGRARLGSSADAGAAGDFLFNVPLIRIAGETVGGDGSIQTIANENTEPTGRTWTADIKFGTGIAIGTIDVGADAGMWIHRQVMAGSVRSAQLESVIRFQFTADGVFYRGLIAGLYRIAQPAQFELYVGEDAAPDLSDVHTLNAAPDATSATLPFSDAVAAPASDTVFNAIVIQRDIYGLASLNQYVQGKFLIDSSGNEITAAPSAPTDIELIVQSGGELWVIANYSPLDDASVADFFRLYWTANGTAPNPAVDTPTDVAFTSDKFFGSPTRRLDTTLGPMAFGADPVVLVRVYRSGDTTESANTATSTITIDSTNPAAVSSRFGGLGDFWGDRIVPAAISRTVYIDQPNNVRNILTNGKTELWAGATLIWRLIYDSADTTNNGLWTTFGLTQEAQSGTPASTPVEWDNDNSILWISVANGVSGEEERRMKVDVTGTQIKFTNINQVAADTKTTHSEAPAAGLDWHTMLQVYDKSTSTYVSLLSLDETGELALQGGWQQRAATGDFADVTGV